MQSPKPITLKINFPKSFSMQPSGCTPKAVQESNASSIAFPRRGLTVLVTSYFPSLRPWRTLREVSHPSVHGRRPRLARVRSMSMRIWFGGFGVNIMNPISQASPVRRGAFTSAWAIWLIPAQHCRPCSGTNAKTQIRLSWRAQESASSGEASKGLSRLSELTPSASITSQSTK